MTEYTPIAETKNFIILDKYTKISELRQKQYEYYREMLLSFPKGEAYYGRV